MFDCVLWETMCSLQGPAGAYVDLKDILETWRLRTPNEWDELTIWMDLLQWRNHMYNIVINAFKGFSETNPQLHQLGFRDKAWSVNKLAYVARRQGLCEVCVNVLNKMYGFLTMEVQVCNILHVLFPLRCSCHLGCCLMPMLFSNALQLYASFFLEVLILPFKQDGMLSSHLTIELNKNVLSVMYIFSEWFISIVCRKRL